MLCYVNADIVLVEGLWEAMELKRIYEMDLTQKFLLSPRLYQVANSLIALEKIENKCRSHPLILALLKLVPDYVLWGVMYILMRLPSSLERCLELMVRIFGLFGL